MKIWTLVAAFAALTLSHQSQADDQPSHYNPCGQSQYSYAGEDLLFANDLTPGIPWPAWNDLLQSKWSDAEIKQNSLFEPAKLEQAIKRAVPGTPEAPDDRAWEYENYKPSTSATPQMDEAYTAASKLYHDDNWKDALVAFDKIAADINSPYRAAAAYSAARASLNFGLYQDGISRISQIINDPAMREYQLAAFHLIGTRASQSGNDALIAAHYAEIEHLLQAPPSVICHDLVARDIYGGDPDSFSWSAWGNGWKGDLGWYLRTAFPGEPHYMNHTRRAVVDALAKEDPYYDLIRALAAPTPFGSDRSWIVVASPYNPRQDEKLAEEQKQDIANGIEITNHAREQWLKTKNLLWGYALAKRTGDIKDFPLIKDMLAGLSNLPQTDAVSFSKNALRRHFVRHATRLLLMDGKIDEAISFLQENPIGEYIPEPSYGHGDDAEALLNGGIRLFLEKFDLNGARKWAAAASQILIYPQIDTNLRPLLANSYEEFFASKVPGDGRNTYGKENHGGELPLGLVDLLPTQELLSLSENAGATNSERRAMLSAGWLRTYLLKGWKQSLVLIPRMRSSFPELATDADDIEGASRDQSKNHLLTHMILRTPGITFRPSWSRTDAPDDERYGRRGSQQSIFAIDGHNPNDGNWWCPADIEQIKLEMLSKFFIEPLRPAGGSYYNNDRDELYADPLFPPTAAYWDIDNIEGDNRAQLLALADKVIAWHPLLKDASMSELTELSKVENGPHMLTEQAITWAQGSNFFTRTVGLDKYLPETLHLAVRSTRYGCRRDGSHAVYSHTAFDELHKLYPYSEWTKKTPYWFDGPHEEDTEGDRLPHIGNEKIEVSWQVAAIQYGKSIFRKVCAFVRSHLKENTGVAPGN